MTEIDRRVPARLSPVSGRRHRRWRQLLATSWGRTRQSGRQRGRAWRQPRQRWRRPAVLESNWSWASPEGHRHDPAARLVSVFDGTCAQTVVRCRRTTPVWQGLIYGEERSGEPVDRRVTVSAQAARGAAWTPASPIPATLDVRGYYRFGPRRQACGLMASDSNRSWPLRPIPACRQERTAANNIFRATPTVQAVARQHVTSKSFR